MPMKWLLCWLSVLCPLAWGDARSAQQLSEISSRSQLLCASAMVYFDPGERAPDPRSLTAVFYHLNTLDTYVLQLGQPPALLQPLRAMQRLFAELDRLPRNQRERYPALISQLLSAQHLLQQAASQAYAQQGLPDSAPQQLFGAQSQAMASLLLDYQRRNYPLPESPQSALKPAQLQALDQQIEQGFERLLAQYGEHAQVLDKARSNYQFVRRQLQQEHGRAHGGLEFYLSRTVIDLDELAQTLAGRQG